jgi:hypothetical protein
MSKPSPQAWLLADKFCDLIHMRIDAMLESLKGEHDLDLFCARYNRIRTELAQEIENTMRYYAERPVDSPPQN